MTEAVFIAGESGRYSATELARGPWDPNAQHGGAAAALIAHAFEVLGADAELMLARLTFEFMRPIPLGPLDVRANVIRPGRRVQLVEASIITPDGLEVVRSRGLRVHRSDVAAPAELPDPSPLGPQHGAANDYPAPDARYFATDAVEIRFVAGTFMDPGPSTAWFRLRHPIVAGVDPTPMQRLAAAADFGNGISAVLPWDRYLFINPDLTIYIEREPVGEWICLQSQTRIAHGGIGLSESVLWDEHGRIGRATQAPLVATRPAESETPGRSRAPAT